MVSTPAAVEGGDDEEPDRAELRYTRSGFPIPSLAFSIDAAWGWPYLAGAYRLGMGIWDGSSWARLGMGLEVRSSAYLTEIDLRFAFGSRFARVVRIGAELGMGVAVGPDYGEVTYQRRAGFIMNLTLTESIVLNPVVFGLTQRLEFFVDTYGEVSNAGLLRQVDARIFIGGFVEWSITNLFHVFVLADYAPLQASRRILCGDAWNFNGDTCTHWMRDINLNVQAGVGLRFR
jgi:hypothetical protein